MEGVEPVIGSSPYRNVVLLRVRGRDVVDSYSPLSSVPSPSPSSPKSAGRPFFTSDTSGNLTFSTSGVIIDPNSKLIITTAAIFSSFRTSDGEVNRHTEVQAALEDEDGKRSWHRLELVKCCDVPSVHGILKRLLVHQYQWEIGWSVEDGNESGYRATLDDLHKIALFRIVDASAIIVPQLPFAHSLWRGQEIRVAGSPFGVSSPSVFMNFIARGVVSNAFCEEDHCVVASTDAPILPGMEGGAAFTMEGDLLGLLLPPIRRKSSKIEFNFFITFGSILSCLDPAEKHISRLLPKALAAEDSLVLLKVRDSWASGIIISKEGHILTNYHLFKKFDEPTSSVLPVIPVSVRVKDPKSGTYVWGNATLLFWSKSLHLDVAILQLKNAESMKLHPLDFHAVGTPKQGQHVIALGHPMFPPTNDITPSLTAGILSKVVKHKGTTTILQTSIPIFPGHSGGLLLTAKGELLGMVTCTVELSFPGKFCNVIPTLNLSIPASALQPFQDFAMGKKVDLKQVTKPNKELDSLWSTFLPDKVEESPKHVASKLSMYLQQLEKPSKL